MKINITISQFPKFPDPTDETMNFTPKSMSKIYDTIITILLERTTSYSSELYKN